MYAIGRAHPGQTAQAEPWTPELAELWQPFTGTNRPLLIAAGKLKAMGNSRLSISSPLYPEIEILE
jgi:hypothetical protein